MFQHVYQFKNLPNWKCYKIQLFFLWLILQIGQIIFLQFWNSIASIGLVTFILWLLIHRIARSTQIKMLFSLTLLMQSFYLNSSIQFFYNFKTKLCKLFLTFSNTIYLSITRIARLQSILCINSNSNTETFSNWWSPKHVFIHCFVTKKRIKLSTRIWYNGAPYCF
jgi:hypothetical protein